MGTGARTALIAAATALVVGAASTAASADETGNSDSATIEFLNQDSSGDGTLAQFDPALGTLTGVSLSVDVEITTITCLDNLDQENTKTITDPASYVELGVQVSDVALEVSELQDLGDTTELAIGDADEECPDPRNTEPIISDDVFWSLATTTDSQSWSSTDPADFGPFVGPGDLPYTWSGTSDSRASGPGDILKTFHADAAYNLNVVYTYEPGPEPTEPPTPTPTPEPTATPTPTPTTPPTDPPTASPTPAPTTPPTTPPGPLPRTGGEVVPMGLLALATVTAGGGLLAMARRRHESA